MVLAEGCSTADGWGEEDRLLLPPGTLDLGTGGRGVQELALPAGRVHTWEEV